MADPYRYFRVEAGEILEQLQTGVLALEKGAPAAEVVPRLLRLAHTLKGAARVVKQQGIDDISHAIEDVLVPIRDQNLPLAPGTISGVLGQVDAMRALLVALSPSAQAVEGAAVPSHSLTGPAEESFWTGKPNLHDFD